MVTTRHVFLSYVSEDSDRARQLQAGLTRLGFKAWIDKDSLIAGRRWQADIRNAIEQGGAFIACFSKVSENRDTSYMREEVLIAVEELRKRPRDQAWFIPVLLDECIPPSIPIGPNEILTDLQFVKLYPDIEDGVRRIASALRPRDKLVSDLLASAQLALKSGTLDEAEGLLTDALALSPRDTDILWKRAHLRIQKDNLLEAIADLEEAGREVWQDLAFLYWRIDDKDSAIATLKRLAKTELVTTQTEYDLGCILYSTRRAREAIEAFKRALLLSPNSKALHKALIRVLLRTAEWEELGEILTKSEKIFETDADFAEARGLQIAYSCNLMLFTDGEAVNPSINVPRATAALMQASELNDDNPRRLYRLAMVLLRMEAYEQARIVGLKGLDIKPDSVSLRAVLAQVAEYGTPDKTAGIERSIRYYEEAEQYELDHLEQDDEFPTLEGDEREGRPETPRYTTIPLTVAGVAIASYAPREDYVEVLARRMRKQQ